MIENREEPLRNLLPACDASHVVNGLVHPTVFIPTADRLMHNPILPATPIHGVLATMRGTCPLFGLRVASISALVGAGLPVAHVRFLSLTKAICAIPVGGSNIGIQCVAYMATSLCPVAEHCHTPPPQPHQRTGRTILQPAAPTRISLPSLGAVAIGCHSI